MTSSRETSSIVFGIFTMYVANSDFNGLSFIDSTRGQWITCVRNCFTAQGSLAHFQFTYSHKTAVLFLLVSFCILAQITGSEIRCFPAYLPDRFGRRVSMFTGNSILVFVYFYPFWNTVDFCKSSSIGAAVTATAKNRSTFIGGRFLTGSYIRLLLFVVL